MNEIGTKRYDGHPTFSSRLGNLGNIDPTVIPLLPRRYQIVGDIIVIKLRDQFLARGRDIARALLNLHPNTRCVVLDEGIKGELRTPSRRLLYPTGASTVTVHKEGGVKYSMDVCKVMFSKGNLAERLRMKDVGRGEVVVDMFAGIGQLCLPSAKYGNPARVYAIEKNPEAYGYLVKNIHLNGVEHVVVPVLGDCRDVKIPEPADRVVMGMIGSPSVIGDSLSYLRHALTFLGGRGILHYHESVPTATPMRPVKRLKIAAKEAGREVETFSMRRIKKFAPGVEHVVVEAHITEKNYTS